MSVGTHPIELQASLRKCNRTSKASLYMAGCETPAMTTRAHETPKSTRGSSIFSPGEAFWNEAIQVADGFFLTNDNLSIQVDGEISMEKIQCDTKNSNNLRTVGCGNMPNKILDEGTSRVGGMEMNAFIGSPRKHGKSLDKGASPLPVKHFDFSSEDKNMDNICPCSEDNKKGIMQKECAQQEQLPASCDVTERTLGVLIQDNDNITSTTPDKERSFIASECDKDSTPSSSMPLRLELSHWLPFEICSTYKKRGISKLYSWQVFFLTSQ